MSAAGVVDGAVRQQPLNEWLERRLERFGSGGLVLDLGCGRGFWLDRMAASGLDPVGLEYRHDRAREFAGPQPIVVGDAARLPFRDASVALVWCIHVLHHLDDPAAALAEAHRVLAADGHLIIAETVEDHPLLRIGRRVRPRWDGVPVRSRFTRSTFQGYLANAGFATLDVRQHSLVSWAAWALPKYEAATWRRLSRLEDRLPASLSRWGAHVEIVARPA